VPGWLSRRSYTGICRFLIVIEPWLEERLEFNELLDRVECSGSCGKVKCSAFITFGMLKVLVVKDYPYFLSFI